MQQITPYQDVHHIIMMYNYLEKQFEKLSGLTVEMQGTEYLCLNQIPKNLQLAINACVHNKNY